MFFATALTIFIAAAAAVSGAAIDSESNSSLVTRENPGNGTWYDISTGYTACGEIYTNDAPVVAVSPAIFYNSNHTGASNPDSNPICVRSVTLNGPLGSALVKVRDLCYNCATYDIDMTPAVFRTVIGDLSIGRAPITWSWA